MKFTLRDLFWLVAVVALALGWGTTYMIRHERLDSAVELVRKFENDANLWQYRAENLAQRVRKDGYIVFWSGTWNDHTIDIQSPEEIKQSQKTKPK
jgi:hypothetical protein